MVDPLAAGTWTRRADAVLNAYSQPTATHVMQSREACELMYLALKIDNVLANYDGKYK